MTVGSADEPVVEMVADNERKSLYLRTKNGIKAYFLGMDGKGSIELLGTVNYPVILGEVFRPSIVCISTVSKLESKWSHGQLVYVRKDGAMFYFSTSEKGGTPDYLTPTIAYKYPPKNAKLILGSKNYNIAYCSCDGTLFISRESPQLSSSPVLIINKDSSFDSGYSTLRELTNCTQIKGCLRFAADVLPSPDTTSTMLALYSQVPGESFENTCGLLRGRGDLLTQHILPKKKILVFSTKGVIQLDFDRPVDILSRLLKGNSTARTSLNAFDAHFGADETTAMCLMLASRIMFGVNEEIDSLVTIRAAGFFEDMKMERMQQLDTSKVQAKLIHLVAHKGLYLLASRLLFPIWNTRVMSKRNMSEYGVVFCRLWTDGLHELESKIRSLENYLTRTSDAREDSVGGSQPANKRRSLSNADADSMECCRHLIIRSAEALCLLQILSCHNIPVFPKSREESFWRALIELEFRQLVHSEVDDQIAKMLISAIMESGSWEYIREPLLQGCPSYCENAFCFLGDFTTVTNTPLSVSSKVRKRIQSRQAKQREAWMSEVCETSETMMGKKKM